MRSNASQDPLLLRIIDQIASNHLFQGPSFRALSHSDVEGDLEGLVGGEGESPRLPGGSASPAVKRSSVLAARSCNWLQQPRGATRTCVGSVLCSRRRSAEV